MPDSARFRSAPDAGERAPVLRVRRRPAIASEHRERATQRERSASARQCWGIRGAKPVGTTGDVWSYTPRHEPDDARPGGVPRRRSSIPSRGVNVNGKQVVRWTQPSDWNGGREGPGRRITGAGTIALQCHDPGSTVYYNNIRIKLLD